MTYRIRPARRDDIVAILAIYNDAVLNTTASYDYEPQTLEKRTAWYDQHEVEGLPVVVAINEIGVVMGWGSLSKFRDRIGYQYTLEHSVYVGPDYRRQGVGKLILAALIEEAKACNKHILIGGIDASNEASIRLHKSLGFEQVAYFKQVGYKFNRWLDLIFMQRTLVENPIMGS